MPVSHETKPEKWSVLIVDSSDNTLPNRPGKHAYKILDTYSTTSPSNLVPKPARPGTTPHTSTPAAPAIVDFASAGSGPAVVGIESEMAALDIGQ